MPPSRKLSEHAYHKEFGQVIGRAQSHPHEARETTKNGFTALHWLARNNSPLEPMKAVYKVYPGAIHVTDEDGDTPLEIAVEANAPADIIAFLREPNVPSQVLSQQQQRKQVSFASSVNLESTNDHSGVDVDANPDPSEEEESNLSNDARIKSSSDAEIVALKLASLEMDGCLDDIGGDNNDDSDGEDENKNELAELKLASLEMDMEHHMESRDENLLRFSQSIDTIESGEENKDLVELKLASLEMDMEHHMEKNDPDDFLDNQDYMPQSLRVAVPQDNRPSAEESLLDLNGAGAGAGAGAAGNPFDEALPLPSSKNETTTTIHLSGNFRDQMKHRKQPSATDLLEKLESQNRNQTKNIERILETQIEGMRQSMEREFNDIMDLHRREASTLTPCDGSVDTPKQTNAASAQNEKLRHIRSNMETSLENRIALLREKVGRIETSGLERFA